MNTAELDFRISENNSSSQSSLILEALDKEKGKWVPMPYLARISGAFAVHSRIADLRKDGHLIRQENRRFPGSRQTHSFYKLEGA